jgi:hypothetical protein
MNVENVSTLQCYLQDKYLWEGYHSPYRGLRVGEDWCDLTGEKGAI